jgi:hypothetical protein
MTFYGLSVASTGRTTGPCGFAGPSQSDPRCGRPSRFRTAGRVAPSHRDVAGAQTHEACRASQCPHSVPGVVLLRLRQRCGGGEARGQ